MLGAGPLDLVYVNGLTEHIDLQWDHPLMARCLDTEVGHQGGVCIVTSVARSEAQCNATYAFRGGQITGQALIRLGDPAPYAGAITGGSGKYQDAEGEVVVQPVSGTRGMITVLLLVLLIPSLARRFDRLLAPTQ